MTLFQSWPHQWIFVPNALGDNSSPGYSLASWIDIDWNPDDKNEILAYFHAAPMLESWLLPDVRCAMCDCDIPNSNIWRWDGVWLWSDADVHFFQDHSARPPDRLVAHIRQRKYVCPPLDDKSLEQADRVRSAMITAFGDE